MKSRRSRNALQKFFLFVVLLGILWAIGAIQPLPENSPLRTVVGKEQLSVEQKTLRYSEAPDFVNPHRFLNTQPFSLKENPTKKVYLVSFWNYSCAECLRALPHLKAFRDKYKNSGLEIIGVHAPMYSFEKEYENLYNSVRRLGIAYPVIQDINLDTWKAFSNHYSPTMYLIDADGFLVYRQAGEGNYIELETQIQNLLTERGRLLNLKTIVPTGFVRPQTAITTDPKATKSPESFFGASKNTLLGNGTPNTVTVETLTLPEQMQANKIYLEGNWGFREDFAYVTKAPGKIVYKYSGKTVSIVAGSAEKEVRAKILLDGKPVGDAKGIDVATDGTLKVKADRAYEIIRSSEYGEHTLEIEVLDPTFRVFTIIFD